MSGVEQLKEQLEDMREALRAFDDPIVSSVPGLRLMHRSLRERETHIAEQIEKIETCSLRLTLAGSAVEGSAVAVDDLLEVLGPLDAAVRAAAGEHIASWAAPPGADAIDEAVGLHLSQLTLEDGAATLLVTRRPGPLAAQLTDPATSAPVAEHALGLVVSVLAGTVASDAVAAAVREIAAWVAASQRVLTWEYEPAVLKAASGTLDRPGAQRLLEAAPD